jgi:polysaccharide biosynthesis transport protein
VAVVADQVLALVGYVLGQFGQKVQRLEHLKIAGHAAEQILAGRLGEVLWAVLFGTVDDLPGGGDADRPGQAKRAAGHILRHTLDAIAIRGLEVVLRRAGRLNNEINDTEADIKSINKAILEMTLLLRGTGPGGETANLGPVMVKAYATLPREPSMPNWSLMIPAGFALGLMVGFGLAFLLELTDSSVRTPSDLTRKMNFPLLGMVPHSDDLEEEVADFRKVVQLAPQSPAAEAFRHIRTNLLFSGPAEHRRTLLITSPAPEDGRTTVVLNLAAAMAQGGKRVLVVDANFRQPAIAGMFPSASAAGLSSALVGQASWRDVVSPTEMPNMSVIAAGPLPPNPADLLGSEQMRQLLAEMSAEYDQVLIDGSPIMVVSDSVVLSTIVDGVIMVVRAGSNSVGIVQRSAEQLARVGAHVTGVILQGVRSTAGGYLRKNYQTYYDYQQKPPQLP